MCTPRAVPCVMCGGMWHVSGATKTSPQRSCCVLCRAHCAERAAQIEGKEYVVTALVLNFKLRRGRYERDHSKLEVQRTGRFLYNQYLTAMMDQAGAPPRD
jgi:hypothetical protein